MNPHKPGTQEHTIEENFLEFHECVSDYKNHNPEWTWDYIIQLAIEYKKIHEDVKKGE
jgi:hypothetical protein